MISAIFRPLQAAVQSAANLERQLECPFIKIAVVSATVFALLPLYIGHSIKTEISPFAAVGATLFLYSAGLDYIIIRGRLLAHRALNNRPPELRRIRDWRVSASGA